MTHGSAKSISFTLETNMQRTRAERKVMSRNSTFYIKFIALERQGEFGRRLVVNYYVIFAMKMIYREIKSLKVE